MKSSTHTETQQEPHSDSTAPESISDKILDWLATGEKGLSSEHMAMTAIGKRGRYACTPADPADLNRCIKLVEAVPEIRDHFARIAATSELWMRVIDNWDQLVAMFHEEVGPDWSKGHRAEKTYKRMKELGL